MFMLRNCCAAELSELSVGQTDRLDRFIDLAPHTVRVASLQALMLHYKRYETVTWCRSDDETSL